MNLNLIRQIWLKVVICNAVAMTILMVVFISCIFEYKARIKRASFTAEHIGSLGNDLSAYFYFKNSNVKTGICNTLKNYAPMIVDQSLRVVYENFSCRKSTNLVPFVSHYHTAWNQYETNAQLKPNYLQHWQAIRSVMQEFYQSVFANPQIQVPVVHFRCSDVPFIKAKEYHLTKSSSVRWMAKQIKNRGFKELILLSCNQHNSLNQTSCKKYVDFYSNIFRTEGLKVTAQCNSVYTDFSLMLHSPLLISLNSSSFSFMAGIAKDPQNYISCNMGIEANGQYLLQNEADWILDPRAPLLHMSVTDYDDTIAVFKLLTD